MKRGIPVILTLGVLMTVLALPALSARPQITILHHMSGDPDLKFRELCNKLGEQLNVEITTIGAASDTEMLEKALVMAAGGVLPDVIRVDQQQIRPLLRAGLLAGLDSYVRRDRVNLQSFLPISVETFAYEGVQYALPAEASTQILYYNRAMFQNAGINPPTANWASSAWTWSDFVNAAKRLTVDTSGDGNPDQFGVNEIGKFYFFPWLWGADWTTPDLKTFLGDSPQVVAVMQPLVDLRLLDGIINPNWNVFNRGQAAMTFNGHWNVASLQKSSLDWDIAAAPKGTERATVFYPNAFAVSQSSRQKDLAWEIVKYLTLNEEGVKAYTEAVNRIPTHRAYWSYYLDIQKRLYPGKANQVSVDALMQGRIWTLRYAVKWIDIDRVITRAWEKAWAGRQSFSSAMSEIADSVNSLLAATQ